MFELVAYKNRSNSFQGSLFEADGSTGIALAGADKVRFKLGTRGNTPTLDLLSGSTTALGSTVVIDQTASPAQYTVLLSQGDLDLIEPSIYDAEVIVVDDSEDAAVETKHVEHGAVHILGIMGGDIGLT